MNATSVKFVRAVRTRVREIDWNRFRWRNLDKSKAAWPFRVIFHPVAGFQEIKYEHRGSAGLAFLIWVLLFLVGTMGYFANGFVFNLNRPQDFSLLYQFFISAFLLLLWCIANWALCTLFDGEGRFGEIWIMSCYAFFPQVLFGFPLILLSRCLCLEEQAFLTLFQVLVNGWCIVLVFIGVMIIHQFSFKKALFSCLLTLFGMVAIFYLGMLFFSMFQQMVSFVQTVLREALSRR